MAAAPRVVRSSPVAMRERELPSGETALAPALRPKGCALSSAEVADAGAYRRWRDVGLGGYCPTALRTLRGGAVTTAATWRSPRRCGRAACVSAREALCSSMSFPECEIETRYARGRLRRL